MSKFIVFLILLSPGIYSQNNNPNWYKGNLHTHSLWSDGDAFPEMVVDWYKKNGYHFIALSDHNVLPNVEKWIKVQKEDEDYLEYKKRFGTGSVEEKTTGDSVFVKLKTLDEYRPQFEEAGKFMIIQSEEISDRFEKKPVHINANNIRELIKPNGGGSLLEVMQNNINAVNKQRRETGIPMFPHINHPNFGWAITAKDIINIEGDKFFEIYNGHPLVNNYGDSLHPSTEEMWDIILTERLLAGKGIIYGLAVDDAHNYQEKGLKSANPGRGWVMVRASALSADSLIAALEEGDFYSSTGIILKELDVNEERIKITVNTEERIEYKIQFTGSYKDTIGENTGELFQEDNNSEADYFFKGTELYVRAVITSSRLKENPYKEGEYEKAWIQPVIVK